MLNGTCVDAREPYPFEELFIPLVHGAREKLRSQIRPALYDLLAPEAHFGWEKYLLERLTSAGAKAAYRQFEVFKTVQGAFPKIRNSAHIGTDSLYDEFIGQEPAGHLQKLFVEFPTLAELCDVLEENWLSTVVEFFTRLEADRGDLGSHFQSESFAFPVTSLQAGLSDPHGGGRCVVRLRFRNGTYLIYKPRSVAPEAHFSTLIDWINGSGIPLTLKSAHCWDRGDYGWMEDVSPAPCSSVADVHAFYWRCGALLGLVYLAHGVDIHRENLIAAGEHPVLIDLEALYHPRGGDDAHYAAAADSVLRTGFLPYSNSQAGTTYGWSALSRTMRSEHSAQSWVHINQDDMVLLSKRQESRDHFHLPVLASEPCLTTGYESDIGDGFRWVGENLLGKGSLRADFEDWLRTLSQCSRRLFLGSTEGYRTALDRFTSPEFLRKGRTASGIATKSRAEGSELAHEARALEQLDIPYFALAEWTREDLGSTMHQLPTKDEYLAQELVIASSLLNVPQQWQETFAEG